MPYKNHIERIGTAYLATRLYDAHIKVSYPDIDDGIDMIAYLDDLERGFKSVPIQLKCSSVAGFSTDQKYLNKPNLKIAYIWNLDNSEQPKCLYLLDYTEAENIVDHISYSRDQKGRFSTSKPSRQLLDALQIHLIKTPDRLINCLFD